MALLTPEQTLSQLKMMKIAGLACALTRGRPPAFDCALSGMKAKRAAPQWTDR